MSSLGLSIDGRRFTFLAAILLLGPAFSGCLGGDGEGTGTAAFYVKDAPSDDFDHVNVTFTKVSVHAAGGEDSDGNETDDGDGNETDDGEGGAPDASGDGWITAFEGERTVDLLDYNESEARALLGAGGLEAGTYNQVVIHISSAHAIHSDDGSREELDVITGWVKLTKAWTVEANGTTHVTADFDMDRSIVERGPQGHALKPVVGQIIVEESDSEPADRDPDEQDDGDEADDGGNQSEEAQASMYVKDAPTDEFDEIWVSFDEIEVHAAGDDGNEADGNATADNGTDDNETDDGEWRTLFNGSRSVNLLNFSEEDSKAFLGDAELEVGRYTQIRVNVTEAWGFANDTGERENITVSSGSAKVPRTFEVTANDTTQIVVDLDLNRSLQEPGGGQGGGPGQGNQSDSSWRMSPVIGKVLVDRVEDDPRADQADGAES
jgi:hypothetical protein